MILADTSRGDRNVPVCLSGHLHDALACALTRAEALDPAFTNMERGVAKETGARFVDPTSWVCATFPCPVIRGNLLVFRDEHHLTTTFSASLAPKIIAALATP